jgi:periplasmic protein TonB
MNKGTFSEEKAIPRDRSALTKYAAIAVAMHAAILCIPLSQKLPQAFHEATIDVIVVNPEPASSPMLRFGKSRPSGVLTASKDAAPMPGKAAAVPGPSKAIEKERKEESRPPGAGNVADERIIAQAVESHGPAESTGVAVAGLNMGGERVGLGSGGIGAGVGSGGKGSGTGGGAGGSTGGGGEGGFGNARFGAADGPQFLHHEMPEYPSSAKRRKKEGKVVIIVTIDEKGKLINAEVSEATDQTFARSALEALKRSTFRPAKRNGVPIACRAALPVRFALQE